MPKENMPRFSLSANQEHFSALLGLLERNDETSSEVWNLIRMLSTNQQMYEQVLSLKKKADGAGIDWSQAFED